MKVAMAMKRMSRTGDFFFVCGALSLMVKFLVKILKGFSLWLLCFNLDHDRNLSSLMD